MTDETDKEEFNTSRSPPVINEIGIIETTTDSATLQMIYDLRGYGIAELRFIWRLSEDDSDWNHENWTEVTNSNTYEFLLENLESGKEYEYIGQIRYDSEQIEARIMTFTTPTEENQPPIVTFTWSPEEPEEGIEVSFDASDSEDLDGYIEEYIWTFPDTEASGKIVNHTFLDSGEYQVILKVVDNEGAVDTVLKSVKVSDVVPAKFQISSIEISKEEIYVGDTIKVSASITNTGGSTGEYEAVFSMNDNRLDNKSLQLEPGETKTVTFSITLEEKGEHTLSIENSSEIIEVKEEESYFQWLEDYWYLLLGILVIGLISSLFLWKRRKEEE